MPAFALEAAHSNLLGAGCIHASQFVLGLWQATKSVKVQMEHLTNTGVQHLQATRFGIHCVRHQPDGIIALRSLRPAASATLHFSACHGAVSDAGTDCRNARNSLAHNGSRMQIHRQESSRHYTAR